MVAVAVRACLVFDDGLKGAFEEARLPAAECLGLGRVYEEMGDLGTAEAAYHAVLHGAPASAAEARLDVRGRALQALALLLKRRRRHKDAARRLGASGRRGPGALGGGPGGALPSTGSTGAATPGGRGVALPLAHQRWLATIPAGNSSQRQGPPRDALLGTGALGLPRPGQLIPPPGPSGPPGTEAGAPRGVIIPTVPG